MASITMAISFLPGKKELRQEMINKRLNDPEGGREVDRIEKWLMFMKEPYIRNPGISNRMLP